MDLKIKTILLAVASLFLVSTSAFGSFLTDYTNITTYDGYTSGSDPWYTGQGVGNEDQEVEPGAATGQAWDLEGFFLNENDELALVGGWDFVNGGPGSWYFVDSGDIFLETDDSNSYYDYVLDMDFGGGTYSVYDISGGGATIHNTPYASWVVKPGLPWQYGGGGTAVAEDIGLTYASGLSNAAMGGGLTGGSHNAAVVDLSFLAPSTNFSSFFTMECGNDVLTGEGSTAVPEPATIFLLGFGALAAFGGRLKKRFRG